MYLQKKIENIPVDKKIKNLIAAASSSPSIFTHHFSSEPTFSPPNSKNWKWKRTCFLQATKILNGLTLKIGSQNNGTEKGLVRNRFTHLFDWNWKRVIMFSLHLHCCTILCKWSDIEK